MRVHPSIAFLLLLLAGGPGRAGAVEPAAVTVAGSFQSEAGCAGDWDPGCAATALAWDATDGVWQGTFTLPAGSYEYKVALDSSWAENYGAGGVPNGSNVPLALASAGPVKFYYEHGTHWFTDSTRGIAVAVGSFQSELGCPGDWQPDCLRSWLQDPDGDGVLTFATTSIPPGSYEAKVAMDEAWTVSYGEGGSPAGASIPFTAQDGPVVFRFDSTTNVLTVEPSCLADAGCGALDSGRICDGGTSTCIDGCRGSGGNGCPVGLACSSSSTTAGICGSAPPEPSGGCGYGGAGAGAGGILLLALAIAGRRRPLPKP